MCIKGLLFQHRESSKGGWGKHIVSLCRAAAEMPKHERRTDKMQLDMIDQRRGPDEQIRIRMYMYMYVVCVYGYRAKAKEKGKVMSKVPGLIISLKLGKCESIMKERGRRKDREIER